MARRFLTNIDLNNNEVQNVVVHKLATAPSSPIEGQIYYNTVSSRVMLRQAGAWKDISGRLDDILSTTTALVATDNGDGSFSLQILDATQSNSGLMNAIDKTLIDSATSDADANSLVLRDANGDSTHNDLTANKVTLTGAISDPTQAASKQYVDNAVTSGIKFLGTIDCSTNPDYPAAVVGDAYIAQPGGKIGGAAGTDVNQGDWIVCTADNAGGDEATVGSSWTVVETNVTDATELVSGVVRIATQAEVDAGVLDTALSITPLKLQAKLDALPLGAAKYGTDLGDNASTSFVIAHGLGDTDVQMQLYANSNGAVMECDMQVSDANNCLYTFNVAPTTNQYRAVILG